MHDFDLNDVERFVKVLDLEVPWAHSYADMQPGKTDRDRRENYRQAATGATSFSRLPADPLWWAFRIGVRKAGRSLDVDNVAKTIIDAFCAWQIARDESTYSHLGLYPNDTFDHVRALQVVGERGSVDSTHIEIFACLR